MKMSKDKVNIQFLKYFKNWMNLSNQPNCRSYNEKRSFDVICKIYCVGKLVLSNSLQVLFWIDQPSYVNSFEKELSVDFKKLL